MLDDLEDRRGYFHLREKALDHIKWRNCFGRYCGPLVLTDYWWMNVKIVYNRSSLRKKGTLSSHTHFAFLRITCVALAKASHNIFSKIYCNIAERTIVEQRIPLSTGFTVETQTLNCFSCSHCLWKSYCAEQNTLQNLYTQFPSLEAYVECACVSTGFHTITQFRKTVCLWNFENNLPNCSHLYSALLQPKTHKYTKLSVLHEFVSVKVRFTPIFVKYSRYKRHFVMWFRVVWQGRRNFRNEPAAVFLKLLPWRKR